MIGTSDHSRARLMTSFPSPSGKSKIEQHDVGRLGRNAFDAVSNGARACHLVVVGFQRRLEKAQDRRLVIDDQYAKPGAHAAALFSRKRHDEARASPAFHRAFGGDAAAVGLHDALGDGKTQTGALRTVGIARHSFL